MKNVMNLLQEFKKFAVRGNAIDLAVGVVIGAAFAQITTSLANGVLTPSLAPLTGGIDLSNLAIRVGSDAVIQYGLVIQAVINFLITALALFLLVKGINRLAARRRAEEQKPTPAESAELKVLKEIRDELKRSS